MSVSEQEMHNRMQAFTTSQALIAPVIDQHTLEELKETKSVSTGVFTATPVLQTTSKVEQHIDHILTVADWLLKE